MLIVMAKWTLLKDLPSNINNINSKDCSPIFKCLSPVIHVRIKRSVMSMNVLQTSAIKSV